MISRVADHCFWLGRYIERADSTARVLFVTRNLALDADLTPRQCWTPVLTVSDEEQRFVERFGAGAAENGEEVQRYLTWDEQNSVSIVRSVAAARENARSIREVVSLEVWETINELSLYAGGDAGRAEYAANRYSFYRRVRQFTQLCVGQMRSTMLRDDALDFITLGIFLERLGQTARILDVHHHVLATLETHRVVQTALWLSFLRACSGFEPFMKRHQGRVNRESVAAFLILEAQFPRSLAYCVRNAIERLRALRPSPAAGPDGALECLRGLALTFSELDPEVFATGALHELLERVVSETDRCCDLIGQEFLGQVPAPAEAQ